jgi:hypothetical protein
MNPIGLLFKTVIQLQIRNKSFADLISAAQADGEKLAAQTANKPDTPQNRQQLRHIIGIERWGQSRLRTLLGGPVLRDEYDGYQPAVTLDFAALRTEFAATRAITVALAQELQQRGLAEKGRAHHNSMGDVSVAIWLRYLTLHANFEATRMK